ncbi:hypothetical protein D3C84_379390 [compost metagenome]
MLALTDVAERVWLDFYNEVEREQGPLGKFSSIRPFAGRGGEHARRVAAVFACFEGSDHIDGNCMRRACEIVRYSLEEWLRYTNRVSVNEELTQAAELVKWLRDPKRASKWQEIDLDKLNKSGPLLLRSAKKLKPIIAKLLDHHIFLLGAAPRKFKFNPLLPEDSEDSEEECETDGLAVEESLRKSEDFLRIEPASAESPQFPSKNPQNGTLATLGFPQNPQNPHPSQTKTKNQEEGAHYEGEI